MFDRYQQRFLTIGLPALLKIPSQYNLQTIIQDIEINGGRFKYMFIYVDLYVHLNICRFIYVDLNIYI